MEPIEKRVYQCPKCLSWFGSKDGCDRHIAGCEYVRVWQVTARLVVDAGSTMESGRIEMRSDWIRMEMKGRKLLTAYDRGFSIVEGEEGCYEIWYEVVAYAGRVDDVRRAANTTLYGIRDALSGMCVGIEHGKGAAELEKVVARAEKEAEDERF